MSVLLRHPPIVGEEGCARFADEGAHAALPVQDFSLAGGFSFLLDFQGDVLVEQTVFGIREDAGSTLILTDSPRDEWGLIRIEIRDRGGRAFVADAQTAGAHGRRLLCRVRPEENHLSMVELQPWSPAAALDVTILQADGPRDLPNFENALFLSGCNVDGERRGHFLGRAAELALFDHTLENDRVEPLRQASRTRADDDLPSVDADALDEEGRRLFLDDTEQLREWSHAGRLERRDTRAASSLAFRWLCDQRPLLKRLADHYGVLLSMPDLDPRRAYTEAIKEDQPIFIYHRDRWDGDWLPLSAFLGDMAFWVGGKREVSWEAFLKFVRNKLGGGHFDPDDRKRWQVQLDAMARETQVGSEAWLDVKMLALVRALLFAAEGCGLLALARYPVA